MVEEGDERLVAIRRFAGNPAKDVHDSQWAQKSYVYWLDRETPTSFGLCNTIFDLITCYHIVGNAVRNQILLDELPDVPSAVLNTCSTEDRLKLIGNVRSAVN